MTAYRPYSIDPEVLESKMSKGKLKISKESIFLEFNKIKKSETFKSLFYTIFT